MSSPDKRKLPFPPAAPEPGPGSVPAVESEPAEPGIESEHELALQSEPKVGADVVQPAPAGTSSESRAKFCPECGVATNGAKFCPECGASTLIGGVPGAAVPPTPTAAVLAEDEPEREVWRGSPDPLFSPVEAKTTTYTLTTERLRVDSGLVGKRHSQMELFRVKDVQVRRTLKHRARGRGDLVVLSTDPSSPQLKLEAIENPEEVAEILRSLVKTTRQRMGIVTREFM